VRKPQQAGSASLRGHHANSRHNIEITTFPTAAAHACDSHPDLGLAPALKAKVWRTGQTVAVLLDRLRAELVGLVH
jgi:hypothetical protein